MNRKTLIIMSSALIASSVCMFAIHLLIFRDLHHIMIYTIHDIAFLPIEVLIVSLFFHRIIESVQKKNMLEKMNMAVGLFFSEGGTELLTMIVAMDKDADEISSELIVAPQWKKKEYETALKRVEKLEGDLQITPDILLEIRELLNSRREFLLSLLGNPNLIEHETFTDMVLAVFHLSEELAARDDLYFLPESDLRHLDIDIMRAYKLLVKEWLRYMENIQRNYPYLFSMAVRTNPLKKNPDPVFRQ